MINRGIGEKTTKQLQKTRIYWRKETRGTIIEQRNKVKGHQERKIEERKFIKDARRRDNKTEKQEKGRQEEDNRTRKTEEVQQEKR
jgi:hypothetical protein